MAATVWWTRVHDWLPRGNTLSPEAFAARHRILRALLLLHVPPLIAWGIWLGNGVVHSVLEVAVPMFCWVASRDLRIRRMSAFFVTAGLVWCSAVLVHLSGGTIEAHFHFFIVIPFITLYQDWPPFLWAIGFTVASHGLGSALRPDLMFNHEAAVARPWTWAAIHGVAVAFASAGGVTFWQAAEREHDRSMRLVEDLAASEKAAHRTFSDLLVNLARRTQQLVERQLSLIDTLEQDEQDEVALGNLFQLDHYATRMRRNAESLIVVSGAEMAKLSGAPQPLSEVLRGAVGEVEDYRRVDVVINADPMIAGRALAGLTHLLAELIENATNFSPSTERVAVFGPSVRGNCEITVVDHGLGMADGEVARANTRLAEPLAVDADLVRTLGLHVVGRLARRLGIDVRLSRNSQGGLTATVRVPADLVTEPDGYDPFDRGVAEPWDPEREWTKAAPRPATGRPADAPVAVETVPRRAEVSNGAHAPAPTDPVPVASSAPASAIRSTQDVRSAPPRPGQGGRGPTERSRPGTGPRPGRRERPSPPGGGPVRVDGHGAGPPPTSPARLPRRTPQPSRNGGAPDDHPRTLPVGAGAGHGAGATATNGTEGAAGDGYGRPDGPAPHAAPRVATNGASTNGAATAPLPRRTPRPPVRPAPRTLRVPTADPAPAQAGDAPTEPLLPANLAGLSSFQSGLQRARVETGDEPR